jgi:hypothetical protein
MTKLHPNESQAKAQVLKDIHRLQVPVIDGSMNPCYGDGHYAASLVEKYREISGGCDSIADLSVWGRTPPTDPKTKPLHHEIEAALAYGGPTQLDLTTAAANAVKTQLQVAHKLNEERAAIIREQGEVAHKLRSRVAELQSQLLTMDPDGSLSLQAQNIVRSSKATADHHRQLFNQLTSGLEDLCESMDWKLNLNPEED